MDDTLTFNINDHITATLTREGINHFYGWHERLGIISDGPRVDDEGKVKMQLHEFMLIFGEKMCPGFPPMIKPAEIVLHLPA